MAFENDIARWALLAEKYGIQFGVDTTLILAVIEQESLGDSDAVSSTGASGLMQLMPATAQDMGLGEKENLFDPEVNIRLGSKYLAFLSTFFPSGGSLSKRDGTSLDLLHTQLVLAAYNGGIGNVTRKYGGFPPFTETMLYVLKITKRLVREKRERDRK